MSILQQNRGIEVRSAKSIITDSSSAIVRTDVRRSWQCPISAEINQIFAFFRTWPSNGRGVFAANIKYAKTLNSKCVIYGRNDVSPNSWIWLLHFCRQNSMSQLIPYFELIWFLLETTTLRKWVLAQIRLDRPYFAAICSNNLKRMNLACSSSDCTIRTIQV